MNQTTMNATSNNTELFYDFLPRLVRSGNMEVNVERHEVFITDGALALLTLELNDAMEPKRIMKTLRALRAFLQLLEIRASPNLNPASDRSIEDIMRAARQKVKSVEKSTKVTAVHVVDQAPPHDLMMTILYVQKRWFWRNKEKVKVLTYGDNG